MNKYIVNAVETVYYSIPVEANSEEEAKEMVLSGNVGVGQATDSSDFTIGDIEEVGKE